MSLQEARRRYHGRRQLSLLLAEARRRGAAAGTFDVADQFVAWAEAMARPVVEIVLGPPRVVPAVVAAWRERLEHQRESLAPAPAADAATISISYPLTAVVILSGALTGLVLDLAGLTLGAGHWLVVTLTAVWLATGLHCLPLVVRHLAHAFRVLQTRRQAARLTRQIARLEHAEQIERHREALRQQLFAGVVAQVVQTYEFYRVGALAARAPRSN